MLGRWGFRRVLPLVMTLVQLGLLAMSLARQWQLPTNPGELHRKHPATATVVNSDGTETVSFEMSSEPKTSTLFKVATALNLPAMFGGVLVGLPLILLLGLEGGETLWIALSALFGIVTWWRIGRWADEQRAISHKILPVRSILRKGLRLFMHGVAFFLLIVGALSLTPAYHHRTKETIFISSTWLAWSSVYLLLSAWGGRRETRLARAPATCTADES